MRAAIVVLWLALPSSAGAQPGDPPPTDAEVAARLSSARVLATAQELGEIDRRLRTEHDPIARVRLRARAWQLAAETDLDLARAEGRPAIALPQQALQALERVTGHPADDPPWARRACTEEVARTHVLGEAGRGCLAHAAFPYGLQLPEYDAAYAEGSEETSHARYLEAERCVREQPGDRRCRLRLGSMQIESRDFAGARATLAPLGADPDARYALAIVRYLEGDRAAAIDALAQLVDEDPPQRSMAAFQLARLVDLEPGRARDRIALRADLLFLCHGSERDDQRAGFHWMRTAATSGAYARAGYARPVLPLALLPSMTSGYPTGGAPRYTCAEVDRGVGIRARAR